VHTVGGDGIAQSARRTFDVGDIREAAIDGTKERLPAAADGGGGARRMADDEVEGGHGAG